MTVPQGTGGGTSGQPGGGTSSDKPNQQQSQQQAPQLPPEVIKAIADNAKALQGISGALAAFNQRLETIEKARQQSEPKEQEPEEADLDSMTRSDFVKYAVAAIKKQVIDPLAKEVQGTRETQAVTELKRRFEAVKAAKRDFGDWMDELKTAYTANPNLDPEDAYLLVRAKNPKKATELDKKYDDEAKKAAEESKKEKEEQEKQGRRDNVTKMRFGGLPPSAGSKQAGNTHKDLKSAAETAFEKTVAKMGFNPFEE